MPDRRRLALRRHRRTPRGATRCFGGPGASAADRPAAGGEDARSLSAPEANRPGRSGCSFDGRVCWKDAVEASLLPLSVVPPSFRRRRATSCPGSANAVSLPGVAAVLCWPLCAGAPRAPALHARREGPTPYLLCPAADTAAPSWRSGG